MEEHTSSDLLDAGSIPADSIILFPAKPPDQEECMSERKMPRPKVRDHVIFHDSLGVAHDAIITAAWDQDAMIEYPYVNLVVVSSDETKQDGYGRQIERYTSLGHGAANGACHGHYWRWPHETPNPARAPSSV